jgi:hypothetical protein
MRRLLLPLGLALLVLTVSCSRLSVVPPDGFAELKGGRSYRAVSPEGMLYRVRSIKNEPVILGGGSREPPGQGGVSP